MSAVPDYVEPTVGWRAWRVVDRRGTVRLRSVTFAAVWPVREPLVAGCLQRPPLRRRLLGRDDRHAAPEWACRCGIYAARLEKALEYLERPGAFLHPVVGRVSLWGEVIECDDGWRAARAYPERIYVPALGRRGRTFAVAEELARGLAEYGVSVEIVTGWRPRNVWPLLAG